MKFLGAARSLNQRDVDALRVSYARCPVPLVSPGVEV